MAFLSHPKESAHPELLTHSKTVADKTEQLLKECGFAEKAELGFYCGLLHDFGKLNPYYQELFLAEEFKRTEIRKELNKKFYPGHSWFSTLSAKRLLSFMDEESAEQVLMAIAGHHTRISKLARTCKHYQQTDGTYTPILSKTLESVKQNVALFRDETKSNSEFKKLDWEKCEKGLLRSPVFNDYIPKENNRNAFIESNVLFSALLQADRGSFHKIIKKNFSIPIDTSKLVKQSSGLTGLRSEFQRSTMEKLSFFDNIIILEAPTGIGKTKLFLDTIKDIKQKNNFERVFYFSPLLALTDDFEGKLKDIIANDDLGRILTYNHVFTGTLEEKDRRHEKDDESHGRDLFADPEAGRIWFEQESFNKEFVITTMQRFIMTIYSNAQSDKMKLASFKNSLLILDEVQTVPKCLLPNIISLLDYMAKKMSFKVLLVSATIPYELSNLPKISCPESIKQRYLNHVQKRILFQPKQNPFDNANELRNERKTLVMANTRKKCLNLFSTLNLSRPPKDIYYLSAGIRKKTRQEKILEIKNSPNALAFSTQVLEAGVDTSFSTIYRELAPLDNIVQVLGRLDREGEYEGNATLVIFKIGEGNYWNPYQELEVKETEKLLVPEQSSTDMYKKLEIYYKNISEKNLQNKNWAKDLENKIKRCDFDEVWEAVRNIAIPQDDRETIFIPEDKSQWQEIYNFFMNPKKSRTTGIKFMDLTASLPKSIYKLGIQDMFTQELLEKGILLPKFDALEKIYDKKVGLDKWLKQ